MTVYKTSKHIYRQALIEFKSTFIGPFSLPFFGCALQMGLLARKFKHVKVFEEFSRRYGPVIGLQAGLQYIGKYKYYFNMVILSISMSKL
jgi:hypothetical protein